MALTVRNLLLLITLTPLSNAIPATDAVTNHHGYVKHDKHVRHAPNPAPSVFGRLRNAIIERIWTVPHHSKTRPCRNARPSVPTNYKARYGNDVVLRFKFETEHEVQALSEAAKILYLDIWDVTDEWVDIRISKDVIPSLLGLLPHSLQKTHTPLMPDLSQAVYDTYPSDPRSPDPSAWHGQASLSFDQQPSITTSDVFFTEYQPLSVLYPWLRLMASMFPSHATLTSIGLTAEGRDIPALRVGARTEMPPGHEHDTRQTVLVMGGSHAREWISVSTTAYIAYSLLTRYGDPRFPDVTKVLDHFDVMFLPTLNPDGYDYTWSTDRLWRKNRQQTPLPFCPGIDVDRAFGFAWDGNDTADNPCSEDFAGTAPLQAPEAKLLTDWARNQTENNNVTFVSFLDLHSYSQQILYPYSFSCTVEPPNLEDLEEVALGLAKSFRLSHGHYYGVSSACEGSVSFKFDKQRKEKFARSQMEASGGSALDFFYHEMRVKYSYQIKLRDIGTYGFLLPSSQIVPTGKEAYEAVIGLGRWLLGNHVSTLVSKIKIATLTKR